MSLRLGVAQQMPAWAKLQFLNAGVDPEDLQRVLGRITSLESWVDEWESLGSEHERAGAASRDEQDGAGAARHFLAASAAYNFAQYVLFLDMRRKRVLHDACVRAYSLGAPFFDPPAIPFEVPFRRGSIQGFMRLPAGARPAPVVVLFNGTNAVKEEMHWWSESLLELGIATLIFDGPGLGSTWSRLSMLGMPGRVGTAIVNHIETRPELDPRAVAFLGLSLGGYLSIQMAAHDPRIRAVAAVSPPYSADIYWNVTLAALRHELAALYDTTEAEMAKVVHRITLANVLSGLECPLMVAGGGQDHITPSEEAWRIFEGARCERELVFYPRGAHDCFNMVADLRPRMVGWLAWQLARHRSPSYNGNSGTATFHDPAWRAAEAVDPEFGDALTGESPPRTWHTKTPAGVPVQWQWPWMREQAGSIEVVLRHGEAETK
jgi:alpha-beta hydrolase superfamily lysophospholipase